MSTEMTKTSDKALAQTPETTRGGRIYRPLTDIIETDSGVSLALEMPGVASGDIDITLENRVLTIRGRVGLPQSDKLRLSYAEYGQGDFERAFTLSDDFDPDKIDAVLHNGVLTLSLPRAEAVQPKKIEVKAA